MEGRRERGRVREGVELGGSRGSGGKGQREEGIYMIIRLSSIRHASDAIV